MAIDPNPLDPENKYFRKCLKGHTSYAVSFPECPSCKIERERSATSKSVTFLDRAIATITEAAGPHRDEWSVYDHDIINQARDADAKIEWLTEARDSWNATAHRQDAEIEKLRAALKSIEVKGADCQYDCRADFFRSRSRIMYKLAAGALAPETAP